MRPVSQSDVQPFERCPALWHATRVRGLDVGNRWSRIGTACHVACEAVTRAVLGEDSRPTYLAARDSIIAHADATNLPSDEMHEALDVMDNATAPDAAISFYVPEGWTAASEVELSLDSDWQPMEWPNEPIPKDAPIAYRGRLDRLQWNEATGELEVWDWKTGQDWMSGADVLLDVQARWYSFLALAFFPAAHSVTFKRVMLRLGYTATAKFVRGERWQGRIRDRLWRLHAATNGALYHDGVARQSLDATILPERPGGWCETCPVRANCRAFEDVQLTCGATYLAMPRENAARRLRALKAAVNVLDAQLRADVTAHGPIPLGDGSALGFHPKRTRVLRPDVDARAELRKLGMTEDQEREWFAPTDRAMPGAVLAALEILEPNYGVRESIAERLVAPATGFNFEVKEVEDADG